MKTAKIFITLIAAALVSGCAAQVEVQKAEMAARGQEDLRDFDQLIEYGQKLSDAYLDLGADQANYQDLAAMGVLAAAAATAGGLLFDAGGDFVKAAGLAGGTVTAGRSYFQPGAASAALLNASEQAHCVVVAAHTIVGPGTAFDVKWRRSRNILTEATARNSLLSRYSGYLTFRAERETAIEPADARVAELAMSTLVQKAGRAGAARIQIVRDGLQSVRIVLRKALTKQFPDYRSTVEGLEAAIIERQQTEEAKEGLIGADGGEQEQKGMLEAMTGDRLTDYVAAIMDAPDIASAIEELRVEVKKCVPAT